MNRNFTARLVDTDNKHEIARWCGGQVDLADAPTGVFVPTLAGPAFAEFGKWVVRDHVSGRFSIEDNAPRVDSPSPSVPEYRTGTPENIEQNNAEREAAGLPKLENNEASYPNPVRSRNLYAERQARKNI